MATLGTITLDRKKLAAEAFVTVTVKNYTPWFRVRRWLAFPVLWFGYKVLLGYGNIAIDFSCTRTR